MAGLEERLGTALAGSTTPGLSVAAEAGGEYLELVSGDVTDPSVRFQAASISKTVTAEVVLSLVDEGVLGLDDDVADVPGLPLVAGKGWRPQVTVRMLLSHRAGLVDDSGFPGYAVGAPLPSLFEILNGGHTVNSAPFQVGVVPGLQLRYSGVGFQALQLLIEHVTGRPFTDAAQERVFDRAGMSTACLTQPPEPGDPSFAVGHVDGTPIEGGWHVYPELAAAGMWCTPSDLVALHRLVTQRPAEWLRREASTPAGSYGLGVTLSPAGTVGHTGGNRGFLCWMVGSLDGRYRIGIMTNGQDGRLLLAAASLVASELGWDAISVPEGTTEDLVAGIVGCYSDDSHTVELLKDPVLGLAMRVDKQPPIPVSFIPPDLTAPGMAVTMRVGSSSDGPTLTLRQPGLKLELVRRDDS